MEMVNSFNIKRADVIFIPNGSSAARGAPSELMRKRDLTANQYLLFAARLDPAKRLHLLLQAHSQIDEDRRLPLVVAGGHSKSPEYQQDLVAYEGHDVMFLGHLSATQLEPLMRHCRAFLLPSVLEGMSNSLLTAMASGRAVLASDIAPNADVLGDSDALFAADDVEQLRVAMQRLCDDSSFASDLGARLQSHAHLNYSWQRTAELFYAQVRQYLDKPLKRGLV